MNRLNYYMEVIRDFHKLNKIGNNDIKRFTFYLVLKCYPSGIRSRHLSVVNQFFVAGNCSLFQRKSGHAKFTTFCVVVKNSIG